MKSLIPLSVILIFLIGIPVFIYAETSEGEIDPTGIRSLVVLKKGWNLVTIYSFSGFNIFDPNIDPNLEAELKKDGIRAIFFYDKYNNRYIQLYPKNKDKEALMNAFRQNPLEDRGEWASFANSAMWIYSDKEQTVNYQTQDGPFYLDYVNLKAGFNFLAVTSEMYGKSINDFKGSCNLEKVYVWDPEVQKWINFKLDEDFIKEANGLGFAVKVLENCKLGTSPGITTPPEIPN